MIWPIIISVTIVSLIAAVLAAIITISEKFLTNYGQCEININKEKKITVEGGRSLLSTLTEEKIFVPSACGGRGTCGLCKLKIHDGAGPLLPTEEPFLDDEEKQNNVRLSCQVKIRNDLDIEIPRELFSIQQYSCKLTEVNDLTHDIKLFRFELLEPETIDFVPGQYIQFFTPAYEKSSEEVYRAYSIASDPQQNNIIDLIVRLVPGGICTTYMFDYLKPGDQATIIGPFGDFRLADTDSEMIFIAGGSGMAPFVSILSDMRNNQNPRKATYYFGANKVNELFFLDEMKKLQDELQNFKFVPVVASPEESDNWQGQTGLVTEVVAKDNENASACEAYLCGSPGMIDASIKVLCQDLGVDEAKVYYDKFA
jgi:Na+-transporting NADH:ubiquinone oxidoreductase subunit F